METVLAEKGYVDPAALDAIVEAYETRIGPQNGQRVIARAWADLDFRSKLLEDASTAVNTMGNVSAVGSHMATDGAYITHRINGCGCVF